MDVIVQRSVPQITTPPKRRLHLLYRAFWAGMLGLHLCVMPAAYAAIPSSGAQASAEGILRLFALLLATVFFGLKLADVRWLRLSGGRRQYVAAVAIAALLHANAVERATETDFLKPSAHVGVVLFAGTFFEADRIASRLRKCTPRFFLQPATTNFFVVVSRFIGWLTHRLTPDPLAIRLAFAGPRAPPTACIS